MGRPSILKTFKYHGSVGTDSDVLGQFIRQATLSVFHDSKTVFQIGEFLTVVFFYLLEPLFELFDRIVSLTLGRHVGGLGEEQVRHNRTEKERDQCHDTV